MSLRAPASVATPHYLAHKHVFSDDHYPLQVQLQLPVRSPEQKLRLQDNVVDNSTEISPQAIEFKPQNTGFPCTSRRKTKKGKRFNPSGSTTSDILRLMDSLGFCIPIDIYTSLIEECTILRDPKRAIELHTHISQSVIKPPLSLLNRLLVMCVSCGLLENACHLFDSMSVRDFNSWATLIVAYFDNAEYDEAISLFVSMLNRIDILELPRWIMICLLKASSHSMNFELGKQVHGWLFKLSISDDSFLTSSLISFYGKFKCLEDANVAFNQVSRHNTMTWTAKIINSCREKHFSEVLSDFKEMGRLGIKKNSFTFSSVLKACGRIPDHGRTGQQVHAEAIKLGLVSDTYVQCGLIDMYGRSGLLRDAKKVFETNHNQRNIACWNALLMGYIQHGLYIEAIKFLYRMKAAGIQPQESLLNEVRIACGSMVYQSIN
ncbi:hypothetical protein L6164_020299 [Bauhinia variegata]|uniref:Uncharacterized protein n=1 Tax=Bauhinia variegata TaxID=167791 RepID=A0ACB9MVZ3_BAUVA|nr:hypothetical protein L6164_020299 [Bauhinia variegata]